MGYNFAPRTKAGGREKQGLMPYSNLDRPCIRECVCLVRYAYFLSRDKDVGHTIVENPICMQTLGSLFYRTGLLAHQSFTVRNKEFRTSFYDHDLEPSPDDLHIQT